jgi:hypothetical protein
MCEIPEHFGSFKEAKLEREIYQPLVDFMHFHGSDHFRPRYGIVEIYPEDISSVPAQRAGMWTRPDVAAVCLRRAKYSTAKQLDVLSFEVKTCTGADIASVHQALAQAQFVNKSYLVWNRPACICDDQAYSEIKESCLTHGIGLMVVHDPSNLRTFEFRVAPRRKDITQDALDEFIESRFSPRTKQLVESATRQL